jgi:hypothetical protein
MSWLLVVQPDSVQADMLRAALGSHVSEDVVVAESLDEALSSIDERIPDVILLPTLTPGAVEDYLVAYVRTIPGAGHVQILGLPYLEPSDDSMARRVRSLFPWRRQAQHSAGTMGCDPGIFTQDVVTYLKSVKALKEQIEVNTALATLRKRPERRSEHRFANSEVPWISLARLGTDRAALINISSRGALLRVPTRPEHDFLRRSDATVLERARLTLEVGSDRAVHVVGRVIRCVPSKTSAPTQYEIAFSFDDSLALYLPAADALIPASSRADKNH